METVKRDGKEEGLWPDRVPDTVEDVEISDEALIKKFEIPSINLQNVAE